MEGIAVLQAYAQAKSLWAIKAILKIADKALPSSFESKDKDNKCKRMNKKALYDEEDLVLEDIQDSDSKQTNISDSEDDNYSYQILHAKQKQVCYKQWLFATL